MKLLNQKLRSFMNNEKKKNVFNSFSQAKRNHRRQDD